MPVRIRLARPPGSTKLTTHYHVVAVDGRKRRDAKPLEILGIYDPAVRSRIDKSKTWTVEDAVKTMNGNDGPPPPDRRVEWSVDRLRYWVGVGAEPTKTVVSLFDRAGLLNDTWKSEDGQPSPFHRLRSKTPQPQRAPTMADQQQSSSPSSTSASASS